MQTTLAVVALLALAFAEAKPTETKPTTTKEPDFCNELECPHFKTINKTEKYEVRFYPTPYKWTSTVVAGKTVLLSFCFSGLLFPALYPARQNAQLGRLLLTSRKQSNAATSNGVTTGPVTSKNFEGLKALNRLKQIDRKRSTVTSRGKAFRYAFGSCNGQTVLQLQFTIFTIQFF